MDDDRRRRRQREYMRKRRAADPEKYRAQTREQRARAGRARDGALAYSRSYNVAQRLTARKQRQDAVNEIKLATGCQDCGYKANSIALEFDHIDRSLKVAAVARLVADCAPMVTILAEIAKCEVVCCNCHAIRTYERRDWVPVDKVHVETDQEILF